MLSRWPHYLLYSVFVLKAVNSIIIRMDWWQEVACWHLTADNCYERFWYFTFTYRRWEMIVPAILLLYEKVTDKSAISKWSYMILLAFYVAELAEYWLIYNRHNKIGISIMVVAVLMICSVLAERNKKVQ